MLVAGLIRKQAEQKKSQSVQTVLSAYPNLIHFPPRLYYQGSKATVIRPAVARLTEVNRRRNTMGLFSSSGCRMDRNHSIYK